MKLKLQGHRRMIDRREVVFCSKCGVENVLRQPYCRQCGMLMLSDTDFSFDQRVVQELTRLGEGDCQLEKLALTVRNVRNSMLLSFGLLILLSVRLAARGQVHLDLFLLVGALMVCGWQFRRFLSLFREFMGKRRESAELERSAVSNSGDLPARSSLSDNLRRRQTAPLSVSQRTTPRLNNPGNRFTIPAVRIGKCSPEPRVS